MYSFFSSCIVINFSSRKDCAKLGSQNTIYFSWAEWELASHLCWIPLFLQLMESILFSLPSGLLQRLSHKNSLCMILLCFILFDKAFYLGIQLFATRSENLKLQLVMYMGGVRQTTKTLSWDTCQMDMLNLVHTTLLILVYIHFELFTHAPRLH